MLKKDWKKNILRVKQIADQNLGRADKTEVLNEELQRLEKRVDLIKQAVNHTHKKLSIHQANKDHEPEKRMKKLPEAQLAHTLIESANLLGTDTVMGQLHALCGDAQGKIATQRLVFESEVDQRVLQPYHEGDIPRIRDLRKHLTKVTLDMDSARSRYQSAVRNTQDARNAQAAQNRADSIKDELDEAALRVEQCKDQLATEMYRFISRENDYASILFEYVQHQAEYHRRSMELLSELLPRMQEELDHSLHKRVFGVELSEHLNSTSREIATVLEVCVCTLLQIGMEEEGLFRIAGAAGKLKKLKAVLDSGFLDLSMDEYVCDVHCIAGALKLYLRELPTPILTYDLYGDWLHAAQKPQSEKLQALWTVLDRLPKQNYVNLRYLVKFLAKLAEYEKVNKMSVSNIAIVIGPNLLWPQDGSMMMTSVQSTIAEALISHAEWFFPGDLDFYETGDGAPLDAIVSRNKRDVTPVTRMRPNRGRASGRAARVRPTAAAAAADVGDVGAAFAHAHQTLLAPLASPDETKELMLEPVTNQDGGVERSSSDDSGVETRTWQSTPSAMSRSLHSDMVSASATIRSDERERSLCSLEGLEERDKPYAGVLHTTRALTPPTKPPPPRGVHQDMYNTMFALHALRSDQHTCTDYMTRVRDLWDGHLQTGARRSDPAAAVGGTGCRGDESEASTISQGFTIKRALRANSLNDADDVSMTSAAAAAVEQNDAEFQTSATAAAAVAAASSHPSAPASTCAPPTEVVFDVPASPNNTLELHHAHAQQPSDVTSASGALASLVSQTVSNPANLHVRSPSDGSSAVLGASPKVPRRMKGTAKKPAPPPPPERPQAPTAMPTAASSGPLSNSGAPPPLAEKPVDRQMSAASSGSLDSLDGSRPPPPPHTAEKPVIPERPNSPGSKSASFSRPNAAPPPIPAKPDCSSANGDLAPQRHGSVEGRPPRPQPPERVGASARVSPPVVAEIPQAAESPPSPEEMTQL